MSRAPRRTKDKRANGVGAANGRAAPESERDKVSSLALPTDGLNQEIIKRLQADGRLPYDVIADELGISAGTVRNRVNRMREAGMLSIVAIVDPIANDYATDAMLGIKVAPGVTPQQVAERLGPHSEVIYVLWVSGRFDLLVEIFCDAESDLVTFLEKNIFAATDIGHAEVMSSLGMFKNQFMLKQHAP